MGDKPVFDVLERLKNRTGRLIIPEIKALNATATPHCEMNFKIFVFLFCGKIALFMYRRYFGNRLIDVHEFYGFISSFTFIFDNLSHTIPPNLKSANHRQ